ncbi:MAG TPA: hypothetical protein VJW76_16055, partial [Verrucomicrobiae bacterium]|nr:hypothetical protein [Verrucomicrobiae bacterium]
MNTKTNTRNTIEAQISNGTSHAPPLWGWLICLAICLSPCVGDAAQKKVLFYGPTHSSGGAAETLVNNTPAEFFPIGQGSDVWTPGDANAAKDWNKRTTADFAAFDAIFIGDPGASSVDATLLTGAIINNGVWTPAISGNVVIIAGDPQFHAAIAGATEFIQQGLRFAAEHAAAGPGLYVASGLLNPHESPVDPNKSALAHLMEGFGQFQIISPANGMEVLKIRSHPALDCLTASELSDWGTSAHDGFRDWPTPFVPLALVTDVQPLQETPPEKLPPGFRGMVHILVKGDIKTFTLSPPEAGRFVGQQHTVTAQYLNETGGGISGVTITFDVTAGPNANLGPVTRVTDMNGIASWTYTGSGGSGEDTIEATASVSGCPPTAHAICCWSTRMITITATDANATEPPASDNGTFVLTRTGDTSQPQSVTIAVSGTAQQDVDYTLNDAFGQVFNSVFFDAGVTTVALTVVPLSDALSEMPETVIVQLVQLPACPYVVGTPSEATVTITSIHAIVTITMVDSFCDETGNNPGTLRLNRTVGTGALEVDLGFAGTANFGSDYLISGVNELGVATMPDGAFTLDLPVLPIPDSRAEVLPGESLTVTVLPSSQGAYAVGTPSAQSLTITEDDTNQMPLNGWALTDLGTQGGYQAFGNGINTIPDGAGGWRGQVVGYAANSQSPAYVAFKWNNGSSSSLYWPPSYGEQPWSVAYSLNDACTVVGYAGYYEGFYYQRPCFWRVSQINATELAVLHPPSTLPLNNSANDINQRNDLQGTGGVIVGNNSTANNKVHAVAWVPDANGNYGAVTDLRDLGDGTQFSYAGAINNQGVVAGRSQIIDPDTGLPLNNYHAFRSRSANGLPLTLLPQD